MLEAVSNTSPLFYLHRCGALALLPKLFAVYAPRAVLQEMEEGRRRGFDVIDPSVCTWLQVTELHHMPSEWLALDLGPGELAAMALALKNRERIVLLDDALARRTAQAAGLRVWGTLKVLLEAKSAGHLDCIAPLLDRLSQAGLWMSEDVRRRVLLLAGE